MTILPKNRAYLRGLGAKIKPSLNLGKNEIDESFIAAFDNALKAHELVKIKVLQNNGEDLEKIADEIVEATDSGLVGIIGKTILFYRPNKKDPKIILPR